MNSTTDNIAEAQDHIAKSQLHFDTALDGHRSEQPGTLTQSAHALHMATAHAAVAQAQALERIAAALEKLNGAMSEDGRYLDVRLNNY